MKYLRNFGKFLESTATMEAPTRKTTGKSTLKHKSPESTTEAVINRFVDLSDDSLKKIIEE